MLQRWNWNLLPAIPVEMPIGLKHVDSEMCWCEPFVELDDVEGKVVVHCEVTWH